MLVEITVFVLLFMLCIMDSIRDIDKWLQERKRRKKDEQKNNEKET